MATENRFMGITLMRTCKKESTEPVPGKVSGRIPQWLEGGLVRVGPGIMEVGARKYDHVFDGLALMHRFSIQNGQVTYRNRFLRSDVYKKNMKYNDILSSEFGTCKSPDPCKTIFQRFASIFSQDETTDNCLINIIQYSDEFYACTETKYIWRIDPETLDSLNKVDVSKYVTMKTSLAHTHEDPDGTVYNMGSNFPNATYAIAKFPPKKGKSSGAFDQGTIVCEIPFSSRLWPCYYHSFGLSENYFIFVEQPLQISIPRIFLQKFIYTSVGDSLIWNPHQQSRFYVVRRKGGLILPIRYTADPFFVFHHINAYEENGCLIVDMCCYPDGEVVKALYRKALEKGAQDPEQSIQSAIQGQARRYVLPLGELIDEGKEHENILKGLGYKATAYRLTDGSILCHPEILTEPDSWAVEMPRINYSYNGKKYNYFYGIGYQKGEESRLVKVDIEGRTVQSWTEAGCLPSEPVFIQDPNSKDEDGGVVLASLLYTNDCTTVSLLALDAKTMKEIARADFETQSSVPGDFHGIFIN